MTHDRLRVAAAQFASTSDLDENLATCVRMLDEAAATGADLIVFPEFANHISVYSSAEHCRAVAVALDGAWLAALRARVAEHGVHLVVTVTVPRDADRVTVTNVLIDPAGDVVATADKNTLMGNERAYLGGAAAANPLAETAFGPVGLYSCMDGVTFETPRGFAVRGARILTNSLNSFALDEAALHIPVRAVENGVFVVAANKVGPLLPPEQVEQFSAALGIPPEALNGAGESQIVAPDGTVLARAPRTGEAVVVADIDLTEARLAPTEGRRPELYEALAKPDTAVPHADVPEAVGVAAVPGGEAGFAAALAGEPSLVVLPQLTPVPASIPAGVHVVTSALVDGRHEGQVWTSDGLIHRQPQLHAGHRTTEVTELGDEITTLATGFGDLAVVVGDDHRYPETFRLAAIAGAHVVAVCWQPTQAWETELGMVERAAENRVCVVACAPPGEPVGTMVLNPPADSLWSPERSRPYDGTINTPEMARAHADDVLLAATIHPQRALQREISRDTDLVGGRSWQASSVLTD